MNTTKKQEYYIDISREKYKTTNNIKGLKVIETFNDKLKEKEVCYEYCRAMNNDLIDEELFDKLLSVRDPFKLRGLNEKFLDGENLKDKELVDFVLKLDIEQRSYYLDVVDVLFNNEASFILKNYFDDKKSNYKNNTNHFKEELYSYPCDGTLTTEYNDFDARNIEYYLLIVEQVPDVDKKIELLKPLANENIRFNKEILDLFCSIKDCEKLKYLNELYKKSEFYLDKTFVKTLKKNSEVVNQMDNDIFVELTEIFTAPVLEETFKEIEKFYKSRNKTYVRTIKTPKE